MPDTGPDIDRVLQSRDVDGLLGVLDPSDSSDEMLQVIDALGASGDRRATKPLIRALEETRGNDSQWSALIRTRAATSLGELGDPQALDALAQAVIKDPWGGYVAPAAARSLVCLGQPGIDALMTLLTREHDRRTSVITALGESQDPRAVEPILEVLQNQREEDIVRVAAAEALGKLGDERAVEPLSRALESDIQYMYKAAAEALAELGDAGAVDALARVLLGPHDDVFKKPPVVLVEALERCGTPQAQQALDEWRARH